MSACFARSAVFLSVSAKNGARSPVVMSIRTIGESAARDRAGSDAGGRLVGETPVGNIASIGATAENPSHRFSTVGSTTIRSTLVGIASRGMSSWMPDVVGAGFEYVIDGHGSMQPCPPSGLQASAIDGSAPSGPSVWSPPPHAASGTETANASASAVGSAVDDLIARTVAPPPEAVDGFMAPPLAELRAAGSSARRSSRSGPSSSGCRAPCADRR